ncbi:hypothetical protein D3C81_1876260 [compost metagenome]
MQQAEAQARLGQAHGFDAKHLERGEHDRQAAGQRGQAMRLQAGQFQSAHMAGLEQAKRQAQKARIGNASAAVVIEAVGLEQLGQHARGTGRADGYVPIVLANLTGKA